MRHTIQLVNNKEVARETYAFTFTKPKNFSYHAGQYVDMTIPDVLDPGDPDNIRSFSLASAPCETYLMVVIRMRESVFKQTLGQRQPGERVDIEGPLGEFTLTDNNKGAIVMLAGGIGITPFYSMLTQRRYEHHSQPLFLFYSNRTRADAPYLEELTQLSAALPFTFVPVYTQEGEGYINETSLTRILPNITTPLYAIAGPPAMVGGMQAILYRLGVSPHHIRLDEFTGY